MFRSVLVPLDGSAFAEQALPWAAAIAHGAGARLDLVRVHVLYAFKEAGAAWGPYDPVLESECKQDEQLYLDATAIWVGRSAGVEVTSALAHGLTADGVLERARDVRADLIVMATHALGPVGRFFLGSVADDLIRRGAAPVLLVPRGNELNRVVPGPEARRVLIALDGSELAEKVLEPAAELATTMGARCSLVRVIESAAMSAQTRAEAEDYLQEVRGRLRDRHLETDSRILSADHPADAILEEARQETDTVVALATHGRGGVSRVLFGSVADKIIRAAVVPVLAYRPETREGV